MQNKKVIGAIVVGIIAIGGGGIALTSGGEEGSHTVTPKEGGQWDYGASAGRTWSSFLNDAPHSASVQGHSFVDSGCVKGGDWARAEAPSKWLTISDNEQNISLCDNGEG